MAENDKPIEPRRPEPPPAKPTPPPPFRTDFTPFSDDDPGESAWPREKD